MSKYNSGLKTLLLQGISEPEYYGDLRYKFRKLWNNCNKNVKLVNFSESFKKIINRYKRIGYNLNVTQHTACLEFNQDLVKRVAFLFRCTPVGRTSDSMTVLT